MRILAISLVTAAGYLTELFRQDHLLSTGLPANPISFALLTRMLMDSLGALAASRMPKRLKMLFCTIDLAMALYIAVAELPICGSACRLAPPYACYAPPF